MPNLPKEASGELMRHIIFIHNLAADPRRYERVKDALSERDRKEVEEAIVERQKWAGFYTMTSEDLDRRFTI
jgi:hypothetical protein